MPDKDPAPMDHEHIDAAVQHQRSSMMWFSRRKPRYLDEYTSLWGEWLDDTIFRPEEQDRSADLL